MPCAGPRTSAYGSRETRNEHAHRRLGFSDDEVIEWLNEADIVNVEARHLQPRRDGDLVVGIWTGVKAEA